MGNVVFAEDHVEQAAFVIDDGQRVQLVVPDDVVGLLQRRVLGADDHVGDGGHEFLHLRVGIHAAHAVVAARHDAFQFAVHRAIAGHGDRGMARLGFQGQDVFQGAVRGDVGIARHEAGAVAFYVADHLGFVFDGLGAVDEGAAAFAGQCDSHRIIGYGLHDGRYHRDIQGQCRGFALLETHQRRLQRDVVGDALGRGIAGHQQVFTKSMRGFVVVKCHLAPSFFD